MVDGTLLWNGGAARQIYILEEGAQTPGFPPNLHLPEGTVWALFVDPATGSPIEPGTLTPGEIPEGTFQAGPMTAARRSSKRAPPTASLLPPTS